MVAISALRAVLIAALWQLALPSTLSFTGSQGASASYTGRPAAWNAYLPNFGNPKLSYTTPLDRESYKVQPQFYGRVVLDPGSVGDPRSLGCAPMPATVKVEALAVLLERGLCSFREKALNAFNAGYSAVLISNTLEGDAKVPDMTSGTESQDRLVELSVFS
ncbi:unnamed protein product [Polarella glacialis]|uniref:PA domain-containing protein n=1 Tax=Polarella glacialis TaxID=89957 RepID=A0A813GCE9_POLGL|nr:unnamed protein product [Polarella glacialis]